MAPLTTASRLCLRSASAAAARPAVRALSTTVARPEASYSSPFKGAEAGNKIPDFGKYVSSKSEGSNKLVSYFMVGAMGAITAAGAKSTVSGAWIGCGKLRVCH